MGGVYLANKSVLSMYGGGRTTGICVDSGEDMTYIVPCWEGTPLPNATLILKLGGKHVTGNYIYQLYLDIDYQNYSKYHTKILITMFDFIDRLLNQLSHGKYSFPDDTFLLWKRGGKGGKAGSGSGRNRFCVASRRDIVQEAKESFCKFSDRGIPATGSMNFSAEEEQGKFNCTFS